MKLPPDLELILRVAPEMLRPSNDRNLWCGLGRGNWACTRPKKHTGPHISLKCEHLGYKLNTFWESDETTA